jgi:streptogramin lyase
VIGKIYRYIYFLLIMALGCFATQGFAYERYVLDTKWPAIQSANPLENPHGIAFDSHGNIYVANVDSDQICKFSPNWELIRTWDGLDGPYGIAIDATDNIYVADSNNNCIKKFDTNGTLLTQWGSEGTGLGQFNLPRAVSVDSSGDVYVADTHNNRIQEFTPTGTYVSSFSTYGLSQPAGIAFAANGDIYVSGYDSGKVYKFDSGGTLLTTYSSYDHPYGISIDNTGRVFVAVAGSNEVMVIAGTETAPFSCDAARFIAFDAVGNIYVTSSRQNEVYVYDDQGDSFGQIGSKYRSTSAGEFSTPFGIAVDSQGNIFVADTFNSRIQKFSNTGGFLAKWGALGTGNGQFDHPYGIAIDPADNIYVADYRNDRIQKFTNNGTFLAKWGTTGTGTGQFQGPFGIAVDSQNNVFVTEHNKNRIQKFNGSGGYLLDWENGTGLDFGFGIAVDSTDCVYVRSLDDGGSIKKYSNNGVSLKTSASHYFSLNSGLAIDPLSGSAFVNGEGGIAFDLAGNEYDTNSFDNIAAKYRHEIYYYINGKAKYQNGNKIEGARITLQQGGSASQTTTNWQGDYTIDAVQGISFSLGIAKDNYTFTPDSYTYSSISANLNNQDFVGVHTMPFTISGHIKDSQGAGIGSVPVTLRRTAIEATSQSDASGYYFFNINDEDYYTVEVGPKSPYTFTPSYRNYNVYENINDADFAVAIYTVSGYVRDTKGQGLADVTINVTGGESGSCTTSDNGFYELPFRLFATFTVAASKTGYTFRPGSIDCAYTYASITDQNFEAINIQNSSGDVSVLSGLANPNRGEKISLQIMPKSSGSVTASIYNIVGDLVWNSDFDIYEGVPAIIDWDGRNNGGAKVASGIYIFFLHGSDVNEKRKIAIIK